MLELASFRVIIFVKYNNGKLQSVVMRRVLSILKIPPKPTALSP